MFTNWLTGTTGSSSTSVTGTNHSHDSPQTSNGLPSSSALVGVNALTNFNTNMISTPSDVVLEVGPGPATMRFMAHSIVLGMHSGYLRSAIRLDERGAHQQQGAADFMVYLTNVTPEQFAPLLSYMYTGYLDLNVENIFGVLLATHVLHMPRALEICRSYLARAQTEGYFGPTSSTLTNSHNSATNSSNLQHSLLNTNKIIRPIASKPQLTNFGFLHMPQQPIAASMTPLTNRTSTVASGTGVIHPLGKGIDREMESNKDEEDDIDVDELDRQSMKNERMHSISNAGGNDDDEDVEVFIDTTSEDAEVVVETEVKKLSFRKSLEGNYKNNHKESSPAQAHVKVRHEKSLKKSHRSDKRRKSGGGSSSSGLQVAKAPIPASQLDNSEANKVIIDVASCDGPVRFKRILNTAYGHKPENCSTASHLTGGTGQERSLQSVSLSFHQQMAKTISQQQHLNNAEESENSETSNGSVGGSGAAVGSSSKIGRKIQNEIFICVYCKHTFKSQYCYQKHAKRHLNPLTLQATCVPPTEKRTITEEIKTSSTVMTAEQPTPIKGPILQNVRPFVVRNPSAASSLQQTTQSSSALTTPADFLRREVRPLDMNVQYYPCKTCGCKFPSYYFVHKHRKMCHADEEAAATQQNIGSASGTTTAATATSAATVSASNNNTEELELMDDTKGAI